MNEEASKPYPYKHGCSRLPEYGIWQAMKNRCNRPATRYYENYGGRGIKVCDRWMHSVVNFIDDMGLRPTSTHSIERIDNDGNYEPSNCRWATAAEQASNKRSNRYITVNGRRMTLAEAARQKGIKRGTFATRIYRGGLSPYEALTYSKPPSINPSGMKGVYFLQSSRKWLAQVRVDGKTRHVGVYQSAEEARSGRDEYLRNQVRSC